MPDGVDPAYLPPRGRMRSIVPDGPLHQRERPGLVGCREPFPLLSERHDVVVFQTPPLAAAIDVVGAATATIFVSSSTVDTDITIKLVDVYPRSQDDPDGFQMNLVDTILRGRFRDGFEREDLMRPGAVYAFTLTLPPIANRFAAGHRIRIDVASSNFPRFDVNPGTGEALGRHTHQIVAHNRIFCDAARPSHVVLPIAASASTHEATA